ncbi:MAG: chemotaxis protein CheC [Limnochordales bacterium]|nr:chemotaxis protein CheC [Limnochordales bacterium]
MSIINESKPRCNSHPALTLSHAEWQQAVHEGLKQAGEALSALTGTSVRVAEAGESFVPLATFPRLVGPEETLVVAICQEIEGLLPGLALLLLPATSASQLVYGMLGPVLGTEDEEAGGAAPDPAVEPEPISELLADDMALSVLAEVENIVGSSFLNVMADKLEVALIPSPPSVVCDMAGALLETVLASLLSRAGTVADLVPVVHTTFLIGDRNVQAYLIWLSTSHPSLVRRDIP